MKGKSKINGRPGESLTSFDFEKIKEELVEKHGSIVRDVDVMSAALYPKVMEEYLEFRHLYGPVEKLQSRIFFVGPKIAEELEVYTVFCDFFDTV